MILMHKCFFRFHFWLMAAAEFAPKIGEADSERVQLRAGWTVHSAPSTDAIWYCNFKNQLDTATPNCNTCIVTKDLLILLTLASCVYRTGQGYIFLQPRDTVATVPISVGSEISDSIEQVASSFSVFVFLPPGCLPTRRAANVCLISVSIKLSINIMTSSYQHA